MLTLAAPAKINLVLEVLAEREDGYHEIKSIIQTVSLFDTLTFEASDRMDVICSAAGLQTADNLVWKAADFLRETSGCSGGAAIELEKHIPWGAGLGGGSSDAAATLLGLNELWTLGLSLDQLIKVAARVGSDVPFFLYGGTCLIEGRGEKITPLPDMPTSWFVLLEPSLPRSTEKTKRLYGMLKPSDYSRGIYADSARDLILQGASIDKLVIYNVFDKVAIEAFPGLEYYRETFLGSGAGEVHLAGSGPVMFAGVKNEAEAKAIQAGLSGYKMDSYAVTGVKRKRHGQQ